MNIRTFPILAFNLSDSNFTGEWYNGTAFLIDDSGHFYTAGHNFFKKERGKEAEKLKCFALINGELFPTEEIFIEYDSDSEIIKKDFACGRIINIKELPIAKTINSDNAVALGYSVRNLDYEIVETVEWNKKEFYLYKVPVSIGTNSMTIAANINISFKNVLFYTTELDISLEGLSGGPILLTDEIIGVLVSHCFITMQYINTTLIQNQIKLDKTN